jgi:curved DNA-binding protein CbpA
LNSGRNLYARLGVEPTESLEGIHEAYRRLAKQLHPDHAGEQATPRFQEIQEAYEILSDRKRRSAYDEEQSFANRRRAPDKPIGRESGRPAIEPLVPRRHAEDLLGSAAPEGRASPFPFTALVVDDQDDWTRHVELLFSVLERSRW